MSGTISRVGGSPTTGLGESFRQTDSAFSALPGPQEQTRQEVGIVDTVHPSLPRLVKAHSQNGGAIAGGSWIELNHSADEIAEKYGTVRVGFKIRVLLTGSLGGNSANATIIGTEDQSLSDPPIPNEVDQGLFAIFAPGIGI